MHLESGRGGHEVESEQQAASERGARPLVPCAASRSGASEALHRDIGASDSEGARPGGPGDPTCDARARVAEQLLVMGFLDARKNALVLQQVGPDINAAVDRLTQRDLVCGQRQAGIRRSGAWGTGM